MGIGAIVGGVIAAGGTIGAAALAPGAKTPDPITPRNIPQFDPAVSGLTVDALLGLGQFDPTVLAQSSPFNQAIGLINQSDLVGSVKTNLTQSLRKAIRAFESEGGVLGLGKKDRLHLRRIANLAGFQSVDKFVEAQLAFDERIAPQIAQFQAEADEQRLARFGVRGDIRELIRGLPGASQAAIDELAGTERTRILRDLDRDLGEQSQDVLRQSNIAGINPGRQLGDIEEFRGRATQDATSLALERAIQLIGGQQQVAGGNLSLLDRFIAGPQQAVATAGGLRVSANPSTVAPQSQTPPNTLGAGIAGGAQLLGQGIQSASVLRAQQAQNTEFLNALQAQGPAGTP